MGRQGVSHRNHLTGCWQLVVAVATCLLIVQPSADAAPLTSEQRQEVSQLQRDLRRVGIIIRRRKFDEAEALIKEVETRINKLARKAKLPKSSIILKGLRTSLGRQRHVLALKQDPEKAKAQRDAGVSFVKHVAPILNAKCVKCHGVDSLGNLKLNSYAAMRKGGKSGLLLVPENAARSLMMLRLTTPNKKLRMPQKGDPLSAAEMRILAMWINQGAQYDGKDDETELAELLKPKEDKPALKGYEPTGKETVSFRKEIAPWVVDACLRCHSGKNPQGGLSVESFDSLMRGGKSGPAIVPGKPAESLAYELMGSFDEARRMPAGDKKLLRKNWDDLGRWIFEGAKYDGGDPKLLLRALNPTQSQIKADELASLSPDEFDSYRAARTAEQWKLAFPETKPQTATIDNLIFYGNISDERLSDVKKWSEEHFETLGKLFGLAEGERIWKGRLAVFIVSDRKEFETFNDKVSQRRVFAEKFADINISSTFEDAYLIIQDTGDKSDEDSPSFQFSLLTELTNAFLEVTGGDFPQWFRLGVGPALASRQFPRREKYVESLREAAVESLGELEQPSDVFRDGVFFSAEQAMPVGFTLVDFMLTKGGGEKRFSLLIKAMKSGGGLNSLRAVYGTDPEVVARNYLATLKVRRRRKSDR